LFVFLPNLSLVLGRLLWWADLGWLPDAHAAALSLPLLNRTGGENKMDVG